MYSSCIFQTSPPASSNFRLTNHLAHHIILTKTFEKNHERRICMASIRDSSKRLIIIPQDRIAEFESQKPNPVAMKKINDLAKLSKKYNKS